MTVAAIVFEAKGKPVLREIELPDELAPDEFRAHTLCSGVSIGTERLLWEGRLDYARFPQVIGYQAVGIVEEVGTEVTDFAPGDKVIWRQSRFAGEAVHPVSGCHAAAAVAQRGPSLRVPEAIDDRQASLYVMAAVGFHGAATAGVRYDELVAVQGCGLIGLGVVAAAKLRGARVIAIDVHPARLAAAAAMGADVTVNAAEADPKEAVCALQPAGADVVFEATGFGRLLDTAFSLARPHGKFVFQGNYGGDRPIAFDFIPPHGKQLTCFFPCNDGLVPCRRAVTQLMARGAIDFSPAITHVARPSEAVRLYQELVAGEGAATEANGIVIDWR